MKVTLKDSLKYFRLDKSCSDEESQIYRTKRGENVHVHGESMQSICVFFDNEDKSMRYTYTCRGNDEDYQSYTEKEVKTIELKVFTVKPKVK